MTIQDQDASDVREHRAQLVTASRAIAVHQPRPFALYRVLKRRWRLRHCFERLRQWWLQSTRRGCDARDAFWQIIRSCHNDTVAALPFGGIDGDVSMTHQGIEVVADSKSSGWKAASTCFSDRSVNSMSKTHHVEWTLIWTRQERQRAYARGTPSRCQNRRPAAD